MKISWIAIGAALLLFGSPAFAGDSNDSETTSKTETTTKNKVKRVRNNKTESNDVRTGADNTETNKRDRNDNEPTADQQKNNKSDLDLTAQIRRSIMKDKSLSSNAHNVKIIAQNGIVTLKGPVSSDGEKATVERKASEIAGQSNIKSEIEIKP